MFLGKINNIFSSLGLFPYFAVFSFVLIYGGELLINIVLCLQVKKSYYYIHKNKLKTKLMAAAVRNKQDLFSVLGWITDASQLSKICF